ncbi:hypothetical protein [Nocardia stercoris]|uniref:Uncharacterized protein n=1 Tax=Nocardia stercoris TaxID=2483361 RepID=A0A3M2L5H8_9NOCA|nr:hypothetical protein [Nocardia stercoris]RMI32216.1 hypothetical protein EBN03_14550 [Nocardia stercoris]
MRDEQDVPTASPEQYLEVFRHPGVAREQLEALLAAVDRMLDTTASGWAPVATAIGFRLERALRLALAERDAAEQARARRLDIRNRVVAACDAVSDVMLFMPAVAAAELEAGTAALREGFDLYEDGGVRASERQLDAPHTHPAALEQRRSELELMLTTAVRARRELLDSTVAVLHDRLGYRPGGLGVPWVVTEIVCAGIDIAEPFEATARLLPECELRSLLEQIVTDARLAAVAGAEPE